VERTFHVLVVEDNAGDATLIAKALEKSPRRLQLSVVTDGAAALDFLHQRGPHADAVRPDLVLLDLNLPRRDGREVLADVKSHEGLRRIPVAVLTTSDAEDDLRRTYDLHANCFITKPLELDEFLERVQAIESFWLGVAKLPAS